ncbi:MAG: hypothetical protein HZB67_00015 [Candidatus Aenigmarchaeota archaeon]|nr:hypothetical protein [Candidatus Aenigmarchaeota archaeon]
MCGKLGMKIVAAISASIGFTLFFSAVGQQIQDPSMMNPDLAAIFIKYLVGVLFLGAAKMIMWKECCKKPRAEPIVAKRRRR